MKLPYSQEVKQTGSWYTVTAAQQAILKLHMDVYSLVPRLFVEETVW